MARKPRFSAFQTHTSPFHLSVFHFLTDAFSFQKDLRQLVETQTAKKNKTNQENQNQETLRQSSKMFPATGGCSVPKTADCSGLLIMLFRPSQPLMIFVCLFYQGFPGGTRDRESACNAGDTGSVPGSGRPPGAGNGH